MRRMLTKCVDGANKENFGVEMVELEKTEEKSKPRAQSDCKLRRISSVKLRFRTNIEMLQALQNLKRFNSEALDSFEIISSPEKSRLSVIDGTEKV